SLDAFGAFSDPEAVAAAIVRDYARDAQAGREPALSRPVPGAAADRLGIDPATRTSLDLLRDRDGGTRHSLLGAVDRTVSGAGGRMLAGWIAAPLAVTAAIEERQDAWEHLATRPDTGGTLRTVLRGCPDLARVLGRLRAGRGQPRDLQQLRDALGAAGEAADVLAAGGGVLPELLRRAEGGLRGAAGLREELRRALADAVPARLEDGGMIAAGYDGELDAERELRDGARRAVAAMQTGYAQRFGVASLKIRHHAQLGYVLEVPAGTAERMRHREQLVLRQGTATTCRFSTAELDALDARVAAAAERAAAREKLVFDTLVARACDTAALPAIAEALATLDVCQSAAMLAGGGEWCRPAIEAEGPDATAFRAVRLRHPVVEAALPVGERFVPNDCDLSPARRVMLLTGPNMAGKSTFLRQAALAVVLAQGGLPVPAAELRLGLVDRLFSRVGAADDLARGRSTFMVEMIETAAILNSAGPRSLVVVDEIGRGTSTLDGLAIAWAVLEALHGTLRCRAIFATHFHELGELAAGLGSLSRHTMSVKEWRGEVVFRHEVVAGVASRSWGVHVARLAGVPEPVVRRAGRLLAELERAREAARPALPLFETDGAGTERAEAEAVEVPAESARMAAVERAMAELDPDGMSPREALEALYRLRAVFAASHDRAVAGGGDALQKN
ncbi:MAG: DNA mismatch repair protein MutS, partial [Gluconacetobacter diazotrophicus]|nr:DNA mismatch repair protein MutS [Gluconacetobacter diazotrophicus]